MLKLFAIEFKSNLAVSIDGNKRANFKAGEKVVVSKDDFLTLIRLGCKSVGEHFITYDDFATIADVTTEIKVEEVVQPQEVEVVEEVQELVEVEEVVVPETVEEIIVPETIQDVQEEVAPIETIAEPEEVILDNPIAEEVLEETPVEEIVEETEETQENKEDEPKKKENTLEESNNEGITNTNDNSLSN
jgi:hypothetical protein